MKPAQCPDCRYDLHGLDVSTQHCPECGSLVELQAGSIEARPRRTAQLPAITVLGMVIAALAVIVTLARLEIMVVYAPWRLLLIAVSIGVIVYAAGAPFRELRRQHPRKDWPCEISMQPEGLHISGTDLHDNAIDCMIDWTSLRYVTVWCEFNEPPIIAVRRRALFEPEPEIPSFRLTPSEPAEPKTYYVNCRYDEADALAKTINWFIRASRRAGRRAVRAAH